MNDKAVLAATRHIFNSLAVDRSTSKNSLSFVCSRYLLSPRALPKP